MSITELGVDYAQRNLPAHVAYVPVIDDEGTLHKAQIKCVCTDHDEAHEHAHWDALEAEVRELFDDGRGI